MNLFGKKNYISLEKPETRRPERRMKSKNRQFRMECGSSVIPVKILYTKRSDKI